MEKIRNEEIRRRVNMQPAEQTANKIRWWSHIKRMAPTAPQSKALVIQPEGRRPRGRPPNRWEADVPIWYNDMGIPPDDRCQQLCEGETSDCISSRRRWQKSSTKVKQVYSAVSSPLDRSNALHFSSTDRPVHSDTNSASPGSILAMLLRATTKHSHFHHCLIYTAESTGASVKRTKMPNLRNGSKGGFEPGLTRLRPWHFPQT